MVLGLKREAPNQDVVCLNPSTRYYVDIFHIR